jgi:hypothetical protein
MKIKMLPMAIIITVLIFGGIAGSDYLGLWKTTNEKVPGTIESGTAEGSYNPADIKGSYAFSDISSYFEIEASVLFDALGIDPTSDPAVFKVKDLAALYVDSENEIGAESVRLFVALYSDLPYNLDGSYLPAKAVTIIKEHNLNLTQEQIDYLDTHQI